ncbi:hypothetical protein A2U01_0070980, partial [Trifolium medium]|nr:hypothetical protein [Trifolium medium]
TYNGFQHRRAQLNTQLAMGGSSRGEGVRQRALPPLFRGCLLLGSIRARKPLAQFNANTMKIKMLSQVPDEQSVASTHSFTQS